MQIVLPLVLVPVVVREQYDIFIWMLRDHIQHGVPVQRIAVPTAVLVEWPRPVDCPLGEDIVADRRGGPDHDASVLEKSGRFVGISPLLDCFACGLHCFAHLRREAMQSVRSWPLRSARAADPSGDLSDNDLRRDDRQHTIVDCCGDVRPCGTAQFRVRDDHVGIQDEDHQGHLPQRLPSQAMTKAAAYSSTGSVRSDGSDPKDAITVS